MVGNQVRSDGYSNKQLEKITVEGLQGLGLTGHDLFALLNEFVEQNSPEPIAANQKDLDKVHLDSLVEQFTRIYIEVEKRGMTESFKDRVFNLLGVKKNVKLPKK